MKLLQKELQYIPLKNCPPIALFKAIKAQNTEGSNVLFSGIAQSHRWADVSKVTVYGILVSQGDSEQHSEDGTLGAFSASHGNLRLVLCL